MSLQEAELYLAAGIAVSHDLLVTAKKFIFEHFNEDTSTLAGAFQRHMGTSLPAQIVIHQTVDSTPTLDQARFAISCHLALFEAVWGLVHAGVLMPQDASLTNYQPRVSWTTVVDRGSGQSSGWEFRDFLVTAPVRIIWAPSARARQVQVLSDGDLFLAELSIPTIHASVAESLADAVRCFRHELFTPV